MARVRIAITNDVGNLHCRVLLRLIRHLGAEPVLIPYMLKRIEGLDDKTPLAKLNAEQKTAYEAKIAEHLQFTAKLLKRVDAFIVPGNKLDIDPARYNAKQHKSTRLARSLRNLRYQVESQMVSTAIKNNMPILAICGGMHLVNVMLGGSVTQHIPDDARNKKSHVNHMDYRFLRSKKGKEDEIEKSYTNSLKDGAAPNDFKPTHQVRIKPGSKLHDLYTTANPDDNPHRVGVLSLHHQGIFGNNLADNFLEPVAFSKDGLIEAAEIIHNPFGIITQFHWEYNVSGIALPIVNELIKVAKG